MARVKISEYDAKRLLLPALRNHFFGFSANNTTSVKELVQRFPETNLVVKVDQGIKKRGKQGLVKVNITPKEAIAAIKGWTKQGWSHFLVEPVVEHSRSAEHYLGIERMREGWRISYAPQGGVDIESVWDQVTSDLPSAMQSAIYDHLIPAMEKYHIVFLEMNPVLLRVNKLIPLDMAAEVDDTALTLPELAGASLMPVEEESKSEVERKIAQLDGATPASLKFRLINPQGSIWMLLSGGGASLVLADEVADQGMGDKLANYGEYSGAPTTDDVYSYTKLIVSQLLKSKATKNALVIAAGVANFTDVAKTFKGIIRALDEVAPKLVAAKVKVFVRRGGPSETQGLDMMEKFLTRCKLPHLIHRHEIPITQVISDVKAYL